MLQKLAREWVEKYASKEEIFRHFAQPGQWSRHLDWFAQEAQASRLDWKQFFAAIHPEEKENIFKRWRRQRDTMKLILRYNMPVIGGLSMVSR